MEDKEYLQYCKENNLDSSLVESYWLYENEQEYQDYLQASEMDSDKE